MVTLEQVQLTLPSRAGPVSILRGIDLTIAAGERVGVVGPSGAGKSTMLMIMAGLERPSAGRVTVAGQALDALDEDRLARFRRDHVGIVFQDYHLVPTMTAAENTALPLELAGSSDASARAAEALSRVGLGHRLEHYPGQLSGGEQQRTALARALVTQPRLLLADEPTGNLDRHTGEQVIELLFGLAADQGATLVLITHDEALAARCDRRIHVVDGQLGEADVSTSTPASGSAA